MRRGEVWWVNFDPSEGVEIKKCRPAVILTVDALNQARGTVVVVPLSTSARPRPPIVVPLPSAGGESAAVCDQLCAADKSRFIKKAGMLSSADLAALSKAVGIILACG